LTLERQDDVRAPRGAAGSDAEAPRGRAVKMPGVASRASRPDFRGAVGLARVATVSFLASRVSPSGAFWLAIAGGIALARVASAFGLRAGYGVGIAAMVQTTALMGPARFSGPMTQALTAPLLGWLHRRGTPLAVQLIACFGIRLAHYLVLAAALVWVILGGVDAFTGTYDALTGWLGFLPQGQRAALLATLLVYGVTAAFYSAVQVAVYDRALRRWPEDARPPAGRAEVVVPGRARRFDPRAVTVAAVVVFAALLTPPAWATLAAVAAWLVLAAATSDPDFGPVRLGLALTALLSVTAFAAAMLADLGLDEASRRGARAALLVLVATWWRCAAGAHGLREVFARMLGRLQWVPAVREARMTLDGLDVRGGVSAPARDLAGRLGRVPARPVAITDAVVGWVASEALARSCDRATPDPPPLRVRAGDRALMGLSALPALLLLLA
jgi:hypothetical protein